MRAYEEFALIYDELMNDIDYEQWFHYIESIFDKYAIKPYSILEMACGTGNFTKFLCEKDYDITAFDLSEEMLSVAYDKLNMHKNVRILKQDMVSFDLDKKYDSIICVCDGINYIIETDELIQVFKNVYSHLREGGLFVFDINSHYKLSSIIGDNTFVNENEKVFYVWDNEYEEQTNLCNFYLNFFINEGELYRRFDENHIQRAYHIEEIKDALHESGFYNISFYKAFTFEEGCDKNERISFVARK